MNITRLIALAVGVLAVGLAFLGWFIGISPILATADAADRATSLQVADNAVQQGILTQLKAEFDDIEASRETLAELQTEIPDMPLTDAITSRIGEIATANSVIISSAAIAEPAPYGESVDVTAGAATELTGVSPELAAQLFSISLSMTVTGEWDNVVAFVAALQDSTRIMNVTGATLQRPDGAATADLTGFAFVVAPWAAAPVAPPVVETPVP